MRQLQPGAVASWWQQGHPGWAIYPIDSEQFMASGALDHDVSVPTEAPPAPAHAAPPGAARALVGQRDASIRLRASQTKKEGCFSFLEAAALAEAGMPLEQLAWHAQWHCRQPNICCHPACCSQK